MKDKIISVKGISKRYYINKNIYNKNIYGFWDTFLLPFKIMRGQFHSPKNNNEKLVWALKDVTFDVYRGERIGIIGKNGAGKTTLLKILSRLVYPTEGEAVIKGRMTSLFGVGTGFKPTLTGRENIYLDASLHGLSKPEIDQRFDEIVDFSGIKKFINTPVKYYSSGMYARLAFSVAAHLEPDILLLDEVLSVGDMAFQKKCLNRMEKLTSEGRTILFVSHSMGNIIRFCDKALWLEEGKIVEYGDTKSVTESYAKRMLKLKSSYHPPDKIEANSKEKQNDILQDNGPAVEVLSFGIFNSLEKPKEVFFRNELINIIIRYKILNQDISLIAAIHLHKDGIHVFSSHPKEISKCNCFSECISRVSIPENILNTGEYHLSLEIMTPTRPIMRHVTLDQVINFQIVEEFELDRIFSGPYRGVMRLEFPWTVEIID